MSDWFSCQKQLQLHEKHQQIPLVSIPCGIFIGHMSKCILRWLASSRTSFLHFDSQFPVYVSSDFISQATSGATKVDICFPWSSIQCEGTKFGDINLPWPNWENELWERHIQISRRSFHSPDPLLTMSCFVLHCCSWLYDPTKTSTIVNDYCF